MSNHTHATRQALDLKLDWIVASPPDHGELRMIVVRPRSNERVQLSQCEVSPEGGLHGDNWATDCSRRLDDGSPDPDLQVTLMNSRLISVLAEDASRQALAGDQLYADLDLSEENLPVGQQLEIGDARFEVTPEPHTGCRKFSERFGPAALKFINTPEGRGRRFRGVYLKVVAPGRISVGDVIRKV